MMERYGEQCESLIAIPRLDSQGRKLGQDIQQERQGLTLAHRRHRREKVILGRGVQPGQVSDPARMRQDWDDESGQRVC
ncbi:MAG: hypothetical protein AVDCRST_MAG18-1339 [uncultured Thermomicrobiales bacterium]|uniref:Uncharacterized protein n=1 Tax=uncultured Thermomicrobiales bacterium TaxID=1645740 RepID=A0A6J4V091_9BACT|nr:MAG: hypothetical protein AVDCRST_MAG18-1339 [uncultured Thermomicrobiales bacterium]